MKKKNKNKRKYEEKSFMHFIWLFAINKIHAKYKTNITQCKSDTRRM